MSSQTTLLTEDDLYLFNGGARFRWHEELGTHPLTVNEQKGTYFAVWALGAKQVSVTGDFNGWDRASHPLQQQAQSGTGEGFILGIAKDALHKYHITSRYNCYRFPTSMGAMKTSKPLTSCED